MSFEVLVQIELDVKAVQGQVFIEVAGPDAGHTDSQLVN
jgi:hypothetical protein